MEAFITPIFGKPLHLIFDPINNVFNGIYMPWARICALSLFIGTMIWVFTLNKAYVNVEAPNKSVFVDLRFWTVVSMLPHLVVYLYF